MGKTISFCVSHLERGMWHSHGNLGEDSSIKRLEEEQVPFFDVMEELTRLGYELKEHEDDVTVFWHNLVYTKTE